MRTFLSMLALLTSAAPAVAQSAWLTTGEAAYQQLRGTAGVRLRASGAPLATAVGGVRLYLLEVPAKSIPRLSRLLHAGLRYCGGFMRH